MSLGYRLRIASLVSNIALRPASAAGSANQNGELQRTPLAAERGRYAHVGQSVEVR